MDALFQETIFKQGSILRNAVKWIMKAMGRDDRPGSIQLGFTKQKGEDGDEQVHLGHPQDFHCFGWKIMDQLDQKTAGVVLVSNRIIDRRKINGVLSNPGLDFERLIKVLLEGGKVRFLDLANGDDVNIGHGWTDDLCSPR